MGSTQGDSISTRLGLGAPEARDDRFAWLCLSALLLLYALSFAAFYPNASTNDDESKYLQQARLVLEGRSTFVQIDPFTGEEIQTQPSTYPPGLAAVMAPLVHLFGWRGAYGVPLLGLLASVLLTALCLRNEGRSPIFALIVFGFVPTLVMSRVAMSDVPSAAVVALGLWCFFRGLDGSTGWWLAAGAVAGASLTFRVSNPLIFAPLFAGTVIRREVRCWALIVGGLVGLAVRLAAMNWYFGDAFFERGYYPFAPETILERLPFYALGLLVLVPGGLVLALLYRGRRRPEIVISIVLFVAFYLLQRFSTETTSVAKRVVLALRYLIPLLPLLAIACAESAPRLWRSWIERRPPEVRPLLERRASGILLAVIVALGAAGVAVHPAFFRWSSTQAEIRDGIQRHVPLDAVLVTNTNATGKFVQTLGRKFELAGGLFLDPAAITQLAERHQELYVVLLERSDSAFWRETSARNAELLEGLEVHSEPLLDHRYSSTDRLRIERVTLLGR